MSLCPACGGPGRPIRWRGVGLELRCQQCGRLFIDGEPTLEEDLPSEAWRAPSPIPVDPGQSPF